MAVSLNQISPVIHHPRIKLSFPRIHQWWIIISNHYTTLSKPDSLFGFKQGILLFSIIWSPHYCKEKRGGGPICPCRGYLICTRFSLSSASIHYYCCHYYSCSLRSSICLTSRFRSCLGLKYPICWIERRSRLISESSRAWRWGRYSIQPSPRKTWEKSFIN